MTTTSFCLSKSTRRHKSNCACFLQSKFNPWHDANFSAQHFMRFFDGPSSTEAFWHKRRSRSKLSLSAVLLGTPASSEIDGTPIDEERKHEARNKLRTTRRFEDMEGTGTSAGQSSHVLFLQRHLQHLVPRHSVGGNSKIKEPSRKASCQRQRTSAPCVTLGNMNHEGSKSS